MAEPTNFERPDLPGYLSPNPGDKGYEYQDEIMAGLYALKVVQTGIAKLGGVMPVEGQKPTQDQFRTAFLALYVELSELLQEFDWKPWRAKQELDLNKATFEMADVLAFTGLIITYLDCYGITPEQIAMAYSKKVFINAGRIMKRE